MLPFVPDGGLRELYDRTVGYQAGRASPFSVWGQVDSLDWLQTAVKARPWLLALAVAFVPRRPDPRQVAALGAAVLIALQLPVTHWFYLYVVWFVPFVLVAVFAAYRDDPEPARPCRAPEPSRSPRETRRGPGALPAGAGWAATLWVPPWSDESVSDLYVYRVFAEPLLDGALPYRDAFLEYPPLAAPAIALPGLAGTGEEAFRLRPSPSGRSLAARGRAAVRRACAPAPAETPAGRCSPPRSLPLLCGALCARTSTSRRWR